MLQVSELIISQKKVLFFGFAFGFNKRDIKAGETQKCPECEHQFSSGI